MDFLKTLLIYMGLTVVSTVQEGPLPQDVPTPTLAPTAVVEVATEVPEQLMVFATEVPNEVPITPAPYPTITPNLSYANLEAGDRGKNVRKLQERLIELGYLPEGEADGAYGEKTRQAVKQFQRNNGLTADGVAGDATQTFLYQYEYVVSNFPAIPATPPPPTPTPTLQSQQTAVPTVPGSVPEADAQLNLTRVENAAVVMLDGGLPLTVTRVEGDELKAYYPRVYLDVDGRRVVSFSDLCAAISGWALTCHDDGSADFSGAGYGLHFTFKGDEVTVTLGDETIPLTKGDVLRETADGKVTELFVTEDFLKNALHASVIWDADEETLMLDVPDRSVKQDND